MLLSISYTHWFIINYKNIIKMFVYFIFITKILLLINIQYVKKNYVKFTERFCMVRLPQVPDSMGIIIYNIIVLS